MSATWQWAKANPDAAARRIRDLERENTALRKDKERMDWLDEVMSYDGGGYGMKWWFFTPIDAEDVRTAIDAARKETGADAIMRQHLSEGGTPT